MKKARIVLSALGIAVALTIGFAPQQVSVSPSGCLSLSGSQVNVFADSGKEAAESIIWDYISETRDPVLEDVAGKYETSDGPWKAVLDPDLSNDRPLQYQSEGCFISFKPVVATAPSSLSSSLTNEIELSYEDTFGEGIGLKVEVNRTHWKKLIVIDSLESLGDLKGKETVDFIFEVETDFRIDEHSHYLAQLGEDSYIEVAQAWDSTPQFDDEGNDTENKIVVEAEFYEDHGQLYFVKRIPTDWLLKAQYPVWTDTDISWGSATEFESGDVNLIYYSLDICAIDDDKFVVVYCDDSDGNAGKARVGTVSGTTITFGSISEFCSNLEWAYGMGVCKLDTDKFVVAYRNGASSNKGYARVGTVSTRTISWGTAKEIESGGTKWPTCCQLGTDKFAYMFIDDDDSDKWKCCACTVSTTTITSGTATYLSAGNTTTEPASLCKLDTDKFLACHLNNSRIQQLWVVSVSGTTCTKGDGLSGSNIFYGSSVYIGLSCDMLDTDKAVVTGSGASYGLKATVVTVSSTTPSRGDIYDVGTARSYVRQQVKAIDSSSFVAVAEMDDEYGSSFYCTVDGTEITVGSEENFHAAQTYSPTVCVLSDPSVAVCAYCDDADGSDHGEVIAGTLPSASEPDISNTPSTEDLGSVAPSATVYAYGSAPSNPVQDGECTFTVTNNSGAAVDIDIKGANWTGGVGWTLTSNSPGSNETRITAYYSGQNPASGVVLTTSDQSFITSLADSGTKKWDFKVETGTFTDGVQKSTTITLTASLA